MTSLLEQRKSALRKAQDIVDAAKAAGRPSISESELAEVDRLIAEVDRLDAQIVQAEASNPFAKLAVPAGIHPASSDTGGTDLALAPLGISAKNAETLFAAARARQPISLKADTSTVGPALFPQQYLPPVPAAREPQRVLDLLPQQAMTAGVVEYYRTTGTAAAAPVAEGAAKPKSDISYAPFTVKPVKVAHYVEATTEALSDFPSFLQLTQQDLIAGVIDAENRELLSANGTAPSTFTGLTTTSGILSHTQAAGETVLDAIEAGITSLRAGGRYVEASGIVIHPLDLSAARRIKTTTEDYVAGNPLTAGPATLWGVPCVLTSQIAQGQVLVGNFEMAAMAWVREAANLRVDPYSLAVENKVQLIAEERIALGVLSPSALCRVNLT